MPRHREPMVPLTYHLDALERQRQRAIDREFETRDYKDEKANNLRDQLLAERGQYATHTELRAEFAKVTALLEPILTQRSERAGAWSAGRGVIAAVVFFATVLGAVIVTVTFLAK
jgi:hypothetical protein